MNNRFDTYDTGTITHKIDNVKIQNAIFTGHNLSGLMDTKGGPCYMSKKNTMEIVHVIFILKRRCQPILLHLHSFSCNCNNAFTPELRSTLGQEYICIFIFCRKL